MRSTNRFRLQQCKAISQSTPAPERWAKPVFGGRKRPSTRIALRENGKSLRARILAWGASPSLPQPSASGEER